MGVDRPLNVLLLCNRPVRGADASTITDHLDAFPRYSRHRITILSFLGELPSGLDLRRFDVIVIHYTIAIGFLRDHFLSVSTMARIRDFPGLKVSFIQDENRAVNYVIESLSSMGIDVLFTCVPEGEVEKVYPLEKLSNLRTINTLTGYVPARLLDRSVQRIVERPIDVGYRARKLPHWLGELGAEKSRIADQFIETARGSGLRLDISYNEADRLYGDAWIDFMASCKTMLGVESGASVFDFEGNVQRDVELYVAQHPEATFEEIQKKFLQPYEGRIRLNQISPRCFEAVALRTTMVLFEGEYSGILKPWQHYVPLRKDFGNSDEVLDVICSVNRLQEIADRAYEEVGHHPEYSYGRFIERFDQAIEAEFEARNKTRAKKKHSVPILVKDLALSPGYVLHQIVSRTAQKMLLATPVRRLLFRWWDKVPLTSRQLIKPFLRLIGR